MCFVLPDSAFAQDLEGAKDTIYIPKYSRASEFEKADNKVYLNVDKDPSKESVSISNFIRMAKVYPQGDNLEDIQGNTVQVQFTIDKEGWVKDAVVETSASPSLDAEALRVINRLPKQIPAMKWGQYVPVQFIYPVSFEEVERPKDISSTSGYWSAEYPGGLTALLLYLRNNLKYPRSVAEEGLSGLVLVRFYVSETGKIIEPQLLNRMHPDCDAEALRVVRMMSDWIPAFSKGKPVKMYFTLPISFKFN